MLLSRPGTRRRPRAPPMRGRLRLLPLVEGGLYLAQHDVQRLAEAADLGAVGVGATIYFGSEHADRQIGEVSSMSAAFSIPSEKFSRNMGSSSCTRGASRKSIQ